MGSSTGVESELGAEALGLGPAQPQERVAVGAHPGQAVEAGAPQQVEQHGLGLVVGGVAGEHVGRQHGVARGPGPGLEVRARLDGGAAATSNAAPNRAAAADDLGLVGRARAAGRGRRGRRSPRARPTRQHEERQRVGAAGDRAGDRGAGRGKRAARDQEVSQASGARRLRTRAIHC